MAEKSNFVLSWRSKFVVHFRYFVLFLCWRWGACRTFPIFRLFSMLPLRSSSCISDLLCYSYAGVGSLRRRRHVEGCTSYISKRSVRMLYDARNVRGLPQAYCTKYLSFLGRVYLTFTNPNPNPKRSPNPNPTTYTF